MAARRRIRLVRDSFPDRPDFDTALSRALMLRAAAGELSETVRIARPGAMVAFGKQDVAAVAYARAIDAARSRGFEAVERLAGGRAAVFHEQTIALAWTVAAADSYAGTHRRFAEMADWVAAALGRLGVDARIGEVPGEYCPGEYSVSAGGRKKIAGIGQRVVRGGAHLGGVVVVDGAERVNDVLVPVYSALALGWDPATTGSVATALEGTPGTALARLEQVEQALADELAARHDVEPAALDAATIALAERLAPEHRSPSTAAIV